MNDVQTNQNEVQNPALYAGLALVVALLILAATNYPSVGIGLACAGVGGILAMKWAENKREAREAQARASAYANICGPVVISSTHPNETVQEVQARANEFREQMRLSGNPYWLQIPVIEYPYQPMIFGVGQLTAAWNIYQRLAGEKQHQANVEWRDGKCPAQLLPIFSSQVMPTPEQV